VIIDSNVLISFLTSIETAPFINKKILKDRTDNIFSLLFLIIEEAVPSISKKIDIKRLNR
jgi:hypothetical protein